MDTGDIREGIYNAICAGVPQILDHASPPNCKCFWFWTAPADTEKPFITFSFGGEVPPASGNKCGMFMQVDIEVWGDESNILAVDPVADLVITVLHQQPIITPLGRTIYMKYQPTARYDIWSENLRASGVHLKFTYASDLWT